MQILTAGNSYTAKKLASHLAKNKENIVFAPFDEEGVVNINLNINNEEEIAEFVKANEIKLFIVTDRDLIAKDWQGILEDTDCKVFCPDLDAKKHCHALSSGKKFAYKNKIQTSKFAIFDKMPSVYEYLSTSNYPIIITPDVPNDMEGAYIAETKKKAKDKVEELNSTGNKKILIEDYISPVEYTKYLISDGTGVMGLFSAVSYFDETSTNNTDYINKESVKKIETELIPKILDGLVEEDIYYKGILGITFMTDNKGEVYFSRFKPFFDYLEIDIAIKVIKENLEDLFYFAAKDDMLNEYETLEMNDDYVIVQNINNEIISGCARTFTQAVNKLLIEGGDKEIIEEAKKYWGME